MKLRGIKENSNHVADKNMNSRRIKKLPFPIILCIVIILASALIYYAVATTDGGADNSRGFSLRKAITHQSDKAKVSAKHSTSSDDKQESASESSTNTSSEQTNSDNKSDLAAKKKALDENKKAAADKAKSSKSSDSKGKTWVPPVYRYVNHPAETRTVTVYSCKGGTFSSMESLRDAQQKYIRRNHLPGCDGTFSNIKETTRTEVVKEAWTEKILVSEGYWK